MTKAVISGYYGFKNFGDEAILDVLIKHLKSYNVEITVLSGNPEYTKDKNKVSSINRFDLKNVINSIRNSDILISGGGSLLQDVTSLKSLIYYTLIISLGILFNKKVIIFAQGIGPINNKPAQIVVRNLLKLCKYVSVRDENSLNLLKVWDVKADLLCDPIYSLDINPKFQTGTVGIQLRDFKTMNYNLLQKLAMLVVAKFSDKNIKIFSLQESLDMEVCKKFETILKNLNPQINTQIVTDNIIEEISELEYMIAMRFHSLLVAIKSGVKTCAINYDIKVQKLATEAGLPVISMDAHENFEEIYNNLQNLETNKLLEFSNSKRFDWSEIDKLL